MKLRASCDIEMQLEAPTPLILMVRPQSGASQQVITEEQHVYPQRESLDYQDLFGNLCQRLTAPAGDFQLHNICEVETDVDMDSMPGAPFTTLENLPVNILAYLVPTRYCESDRLGELAWSIVKNETPGYDQVTKITSWIRDHIPYTPGTSDIPLSADEVRQRGHGVCRDLTHLGIAMCRSISIPARMVVGYLHELEPMDLHAWFEAFVGDRWYTFDPTQRELKGGRIAVGYGRDAADVAILHQFGPLPIFSAMTVEVQLIAE